MELKLNGRSIPITLKGLLSLIQTVALIGTMIVAAWRAAKRVSNAFDGMQAKIQLHDELDKEVLKTEKQIQTEQEHLGYRMSRIEGAIFGKKAILLPLDPAKPQKESAKP